MEYNHLNFPDLLPLSPPEEEEDMRHRCRCCGELNKITYRDRGDSTVYGCEHCIVELVGSDTTYPYFIDCPTCKSEAVYLFMDRSSGKIVGCDSCVEVVGAE
jgi:ribosomal protein L37AE/L43A